MNSSALAGVLGEDPSHHRLHALDGERLPVQPEHAVAVLGPPQECDGLTHRRLRRHLRAANPVELGTRLDAPASG